MEESIIKVNNPMLRGSVSFPGWNVYSTKFVDVLVMLAKRGVIHKFSVKNVDEYSVRVNYVFYAEDRAEAEKYIRVGGE